jgi:thiol-disulfide isomerase/thioredoxin
VLSPIIESDVLQKDAKTICYSDEFAAVIQSLKTSIESKETFDQICSTLEIESDPITSNLGVEDKQFLIEYTALEKFLDVPSEDLIRYSFLLDQFPPNPVPTHGSPESFLPVSGEKLITGTKLFSLLIVFIWRDECKPCEIVKDDFDEISSTYLQGIGLFSVFGPSTSQLLTEQFKVHGGPTTLFIRNGDVETRFVGAPHKAALKNEIQALQSI